MIDTAKPRGQTMRYYKTGLEVEQVAKLVKEHFYYDRTPVEISGSEDAVYFHTTPWSKLLGFSTEGVIGRCSEGALLSVTIGEIRLFRYLQLSITVLLFILNLFFDHLKEIQITLLLVSFIPMFDFILYYRSRYKLTSFLKRNAVGWKKIREKEYLDLRLETDRLAYEKE